MFGDGPGRPRNLGPAALIAHLGLVREDELLAFGDLAGAVFDLLRELGPRLAALAALAAGLDALHQPGLLAVEELHGQLRLLEQVGELVGTLLVMSPELQALPRGGCGRAH